MRFIYLFIYLFLYVNVIKGFAYYTRISNKYVCVCVYLSPLFGVVWEEYVKSLGI